MKASIQALKGLRLVEQKDGIMFKSPEQALAVKTAIKATEPMICVLPTGGGKTAIFHVPAFLERSKGLLTVVIVPLVALMDDHIHRLNKRGIPGFKSFQWDGQWYKIGIPQDVSILFVSMETAATTTFLNALKLIESRLARIVVVDEAHLAITWSDFRSDMHKLVYILCCQQQFRQGWRVMLWALLYANNNPHSFVLRCSVGHQQDHLLPALVELLKSTHRKTAS